MGKSRRVADLDIDFDSAHEEREWVAQRVAWVLMFCAVIAGLVGLLGPGLLGETHQGKPGDPLYVEYQRFCRHQAPAELKVFCRPGGSRREFELALDRNFFESAGIEEISPEPVETRSDGDRYVFRFTRGAGNEHLVRIRFEPSAFGRRTTKLKLDESATVIIRFFYWP